MIKSGDWTGSEESNELNRRHTGMGRRWLVYVHEMECFFADILDKYMRLEEALEKDRKHGDNDQVHGSAGIRSFAVSRHVGPRRVHSRILRYFRDLHTSMTRCKTEIDRWIEGEI